MPMHWDEEGSRIRAVQRRCMDMLAASARAHDRFRDTIRELAALWDLAGGDMLTDRRGHERLRRERGCQVILSDSGKEWTFRFRLRGENGVVRRYRERTGYPATPENKAKLEENADLIAAEIKTGRFRYAEWFPQSVARKAERERQIEFGPWRRAGAQTLEAWFNRWIVDKRAERDAVPPKLAASAIVSYEQHFEDHLLPEIQDFWPGGRLKLNRHEPSGPRLERLRTALRRKEKQTRPGEHLSEKTIRNIIDGTLRAAIRDAIAANWPATMDGFEALQWASYEPPEATPFREDEVERLLRYFAAKLWKVGGFNETRIHYPYYAYVYLLFDAPLRPSEAAALRLTALSLDGDLPYVKVRESYHRGNTGRVKTHSARRTVYLSRGTAVVLRPLLQLRARPDDYLFTNPWGQPIKNENFGKLFVEAQRACGITPLRDFYSTKDTWVTRAKRNRVHPDVIEDQTGVAIATLDKHYAAVMADDDFRRMELAKIDRKPPRRARLREKNGRAQDSA